MLGRELAHRYRVTAPLGHGGMASVWKATDLLTGRSVAVKVLSAPGPADPQIVACFGREATALGHLAHRNIVDRLGSGTQDGEPYLVMELIDGPSLARQLAAGPLPIRRALTIAHQLCGGLAAIHAAGIVHRDLKPANILLAGDGTVKICDFGIARLAHDVGQPTFSGGGIAVGTVDYMAPEQALGHPVDERTDLYGLGCLLYAMLTGHPPFHADDPVAVLHQHVEHKVPSVRAARPDTPPALEALVRSLLAKKPGRRPADADQVRTTLAAILTALPGPDQDTAAVPRSPAWTRTARAKVLVGAGAAALALAATITLAATAQSAPTTSRFVTGTTARTPGAAIIAVITPVTPPAPTPSTIRDLKDTRTDSTRNKPKHRPHEHPDGH